MRPPAPPPPHRVSLNPCYEPLVLQLWVNSFYLLGHHGHFSMHIHTYYSRSEIKYVNISHNFPPSGFLCSGNVLRARTGLLKEGVDLSLYSLAVADFLEDVTWCSLEMEEEPARERLAPIISHLPSGCSRTPHSLDSGSCLTLVLCLLREHRFGGLTVAADDGASAVDDGVLVLLPSLGFG